MKSKIVILICCFSLLATSVYACGGGNCCFLFDSAIFYGYKEEGAFVQAPAALGSFVGVVSGGIVALPFGVLALPFGKFNEVSHTVSIIVAQSCSFITGLPFYVTKKVFYDFPKAVFE